MYSNTVVATEIDWDEGRQLVPAFYDMESGLVYLSRYADGRLAPIHIHDGLPPEVAKRSELNVIAGFTLNKRFLTREQAVRYQRKQVA